MLDICIIQTPYPFVIQLAYFQMCSSSDENQDNCSHDVEKKLLVTEYFNFHTRYHPKIYETSTYTKVYHRGSNSLFRVNVLK